MYRRILAFLIIVAGLTAGLLYSQWIEDPLKVSGYIEADEIRVGSRVGGRVSRVLVEEGQSVSRGDLLVELEPFDLLEQRAKAAAELAASAAELERLSSGFREEEIAQAKAKRDQLAARLEKLVNGPRKEEIAAAQAQVELAEAQLELAQLRYRRVETLYKQGTSPREDLDRANTELRVAQSTLQVRREELAILLEGTRPEEISEAKAMLEEAKESLNLRVNGYRPEDIARAEATVRAASAALATVDQHIEELTIRAPMNSAVEAIDLQPGDLVAPNAPVVSLMDTSHLWVRAYVPEDELDIELGQQVSITVDSYPDERFDAHISFIAREGEFTPSNVQTPEERSKQVFRIKVTVDEALDRLRPGMAADVWLEREE